MTDCNELPVIKMCGFTRLEDLRFAQALGIAYCGFVFFELSPRYISPVAAAHLIAHIEAPRTLSPVGLFVNHAEKHVVQAVKDSGVKVLQFHGNESPAYCEQLSQTLGLPYWKVIHITEHLKVQDLLKLCLIYSSAQALLFDTASPAWGGTGQTFEWQTLEPIAQLGNVPPLVLSGGLTAQNVAQGIALIKPWAIDVSSGIEAQDALGRPLKGVKDPKKMADFVAASYRNK